MDARDAEILREWVESNLAGAAAVRRARIVLLAAAGRGTASIADELGCSKQTVITWRERYRAEGIAGLRDAPRSGRPSTVDAAAVIGRTLAPPPPRLGAPRWTTRLLGAELGISNVAVANVWRSWGVLPDAGGRVRLDTEPVLDGAVGAVVGLHLAPPVRVLALLWSEPAGGPEAVVPVPKRPGIGTRLAELDLGPGGDPGGLAAFLDRTEALSEPPALLADAAGADAALLADRAARSGAAVHAVPADLSWTRMVRVVCVLAGATAVGGDSVRALRAALAAHVPGAPFSWVTQTAAAQP
ncbi:helix-turn-helix domain-containing protein [Pseudonocardia nigra]|uniref:helix-turn-helix domain-containing protein n=1 Tax=Pseudonocardia nigra TaxID=1921578 RepID=UPI001C5E6E2F|nr:helix-turn-helix domain-containing protein [Pseudonocardia nigra]